jgi:transcriptional regulator with XRE-family HTH domain
MQQSPGVAPTNELGPTRAEAATPPTRRRGRRAAPPAESPVAQELRRRREMLHLTVRAAALRCGVPPSVISEIETGRRVPSLPTYAKLRRELGLEVPPSALIPAAARPEQDLFEDHLTALAACVLTHRGRPLADLARALGVSIPAVREGILRITDRVAAVGFRVVEDAVDVRLAPVGAAARALDDLGAVERLPELQGDHLELICIVAHLGSAVRSQIEAMFGRDCELLLQRLTDRGYFERIAKDRGAVGAPHVYRVTAAAIAATGQDTLASPQRFLAAQLDSQQVPNRASSASEHDGTGRAGLLVTASASRQVAIEHG